MPRIISVVFLWYIKRESLEKAPLRSSGRFPKILKTRLDAQTREELQSDSSLILSCRLPARGALNGFSWRVDPVQTLAPFLTTSCQPAATSRKGGSPDSAARRSCSFVPITFGKRLLFAEFCSFVEERAVASKRRGPQRPLDPVRSGLIADAGAGPAAAATDDSRLATGRGCGEDGGEPRCVGNAGLPAPGGPRIRAPMRALRRRRLCGLYGVTTQPGARVRCASARPRMPARTLSAPTPFPKLRRDGCALSAGWWVVIETDNRLCRPAAGAPLQRGRHAATAIGPRDLRVTADARPSPPTRKSNDREVTGTP